MYEILYMAIMVKLILPDRAGEPGGQCTAASALCDEKGKQGSGVGDLIQDAGVNKHCRNLALFVAAALHDEHRAMKGDVVLHRLPLRYIDPNRLETIKVLEDVIFRPSPPQVVVAHRRRVDHGVKSEEAARSVGDRLHIGKVKP